MTIKLSIEMDTDWCETIIQNNARWTLADGTFTIEGLGMGAFQMNDKLIGIGKARQWDAQKITINVFVQTAETVLTIHSRKGAAGPVKYWTYLNGRQVDYAVNDTNQDPLAIQLGLSFKQKAMLDEDAEKGTIGLAQPGVLRTLKPSDE